MIRLKLRFFLTTTACSLFLLCSLMPQFAVAQTKLKYRFQPNQQLQYELKQTLTTKTESQGINNEKTISQHLNLSTTVEKVAPDGSARVRKSIDRIRLTATQPGNEKELEYDSAKKKEVTGQFAMIVKSMTMLVGQEIGMTVSPQGESDDVAIPEALNKRFGGPAGNEGGVNSSEGVKKMMSQGSVIFPDKPLSVGEKWKRELTTDLPYGTMRSLVIFSYAGQTKEGIHRIDAKTKITIEPNPKLPFQIKMKESEGNGVYMFDATRGLILASGLKQTMNMEIEAAGQTVKQSVITDISMRFVKQAAKVSTVR